MPSLDELAAVEAARLSSAMRRRCFAACLDELAAVEAARQRPELGRLLQAFRGSLRRVDGGDLWLIQLSRTVATADPANAQLWLRFAWCAGWPGFLFQRRPRRSEDECVSVTGQVWDLTEVGDRAASAEDVAEIA